jgi:hypothetical protein
MRNVALLSVVAPSKKELMCAAPFEQRIFFSHFFAKWPHIKKPSPSISVPTIMGVKAIKLFPHFFSAYSSNCGWHLTDAVFCTLPPPALTETVTTKTFERVK